MEGQTDHKICSLANSEAGCMAKLVQLSRMNAIFPGRLMSFHIAWVQIDIPVEAVDSLSAICSRDNGSVSCCRVILIFNSMD